MDCIDCHNRPTHIYRMPASEIDQALQEGLIDRTLPYVRREGLRLMRETYPTAEAAASEITRDLEEFYAANYPELSTARHADITDAGRRMGELHNRNVFPKMKVTWGAYPNHLGHADFPGCFRCHDDEHLSEDGETISQDCSTCHTLLAMEEENPEVLELLQP
jgi:hypothetical protein